jgi:hypothetical protein
VDVRDVVNLFMIRHTVLLKTKVDGTGVLLIWGT